MAASVGGSQWDDFEFTKDEVNNIKEALKKEEFRKLLVEYCEEVNDPENRKKYQEEITELERERGYDVTFVNPEPGYVIKTSVDGQKKTFINVCKSDKVGKPTSVPTTKSGSRGLNWSLPYSQIHPRDDLDKSGKRCVVYDVVFHPDTLRLAENNKHFRNMLNSTALDAVETTYNVKLDRKNLKITKTKYKGCVPNSVFRKKNDTTIDSTTVEELEKLKYPFFKESETDQNLNSRNISKNNSNKSGVDPNSDTPYTTPKYLIKHRSSLDVLDFVNDKSAKMNAAIPKELVVEIDLPLLSSSKNLVLDVNEKSVAIKSDKQARYKLNIELPYQIDEDMSNAKFDAKLRKLFVTLPVKYKNISQIDGGRYDSGVESDQGLRTPECSSADEDSGENNSEPLINVENNACEVVRTEVLREVNGGDVIRTNSVDTIMFLDPDKHYTFPSFTCNVFEEVVAFTLHVKNVDPTSVKHCVLGENSYGVHVQFTSVGSGFFPVHHAFCVKFPPEFSVDQECLNIETWDNNVIVQIQLKTCDTILTEYYVGVDESSAVSHEILEPAVLEKKAQTLKDVAESDSTLSNDLKIEVTKVSKDEIEIEISPKKNQDIDPSTLVESVGELTLDDSDKNNIVAGDSPSPSSNQPFLEKCRTLSESSGDEVCTSPTKKGILKNKGRVYRSLSESSADDYTWSSSLDIMGPSGGSDSCIPEEDEADTEHKKTVRFNDVISQKIYRNNSSILGQRKKNQRKTRNKKRAQERRASESETSEGEIDKDRDRDIEEDDDALESETYIDTSSEPQPGPSGLQAVNKEGASVPHVDLKNDLIFSLEM